MAAVEESERGIDRELNLKITWVAKDRNSRRTTKGRQTGCIAVFPSAFFLHHHYYLLLSTGRSAPMVSTIWASLATRGRAGRRGHRARPPPRLRRHGGRMAGSRRWGLAAAAADHTSRTIGRGARAAGAGAGASAVAAPVEPVRRITTTMVTTPSCLRPQTQVPFGRLVQAD